MPVYGRNLKRGREKMRKPGGRGRVYGNRDYGCNAL